PIPPRHVLNGILVDDLLTTTINPFSPAAIEDFSWSPFTIHKLSTSIFPSTHNSDLPLIQKLLLFKNALNTPDSFILLLTTTQPLRDQMPIRHYRDWLLFLIHAARAHHSPLILLTPPANPAIPFETRRQYILLTKEVAYLTHTPIIDLYAISFLDPPPANPGPKLSDIPDTTFVTRFLLPHIHQQLLKITGLQRP
ncbi:MAG: hypothetical protein D6820_04940, partial [Lentisphaerae bacterium]